jgi:chemotaxis protein MotA
MGVSFSTIFGVLAGAAVVIWGALSNGSSPQMFYSPSSLAIVLGGTITASFIGYRGRYIVRALIGIPGIFLRQSVGPKSLKKDVEMIVGWSKRIQQDGKKAAESIAEENKDDFTKYIWNLFATGYDADEIQNFGETNIEEHYFRHLSEVQILTNMAGSAPAFGMVGTLLGLIVMLADMDDPSKMGPGLSTALMTTLYGVLVARFVFLPSSSKVKQKLSIERFRRYLLLQGVVLIAEKRSNFYIADRLNSYLDLKNHFSDQS